jgi:CRISPR-associated endonuclease/helicase Cas3
MFARTLAFIRAHAPARIVDLQLVHGGTALNENFQELRHATIHDADGEGSIRAGEWFTHRKRALLSEYGVGTVDQALLPILPVRHNFVRLWGLANRVVVFDEIHAYDAYTGTLLIQLIQWLHALGSSVVLLSATLPPSIRRQIAGILHASLPETEAPYPRLTVIQPDGVHQIGFKPDPARRQVIQLEPVVPELDAIKEGIACRLGPTGSALALLNTVQRAQALYSLYPEGELLLHQGLQVGKRLPDGTEVSLFHARFPADLRQVREDHALAMFGEKGLRDARRILIATQVAEQSLDLDFDLMATDLAPIDLLLQRAGRLWRHKRMARGASTPVLLVAGLDAEEPPAFEAPLWWGAVYREDVLLRTWALLKDRSALTLPDEIDDLVSLVYEDEVVLPKFLLPRKEKACEKGEGEAAACRSRAHMATIGSPDDASWNDPARFLQADEDEPGLHPSLRALTRLGDASLTAIPIRHDEMYDPGETPSVEQARTWSRRSMSLSRKRIVAKLLGMGVPEGWRRSTHLRHAFPLRLDVDGRWQEDPLVRLDGALGLVFDTKEAP